MVVAEHVSLPLTAEAVVLLKTSQNLHASNFPLIVGALPAARDAHKTGFDLAHDWLVSEGLDPNGAVQGDGAGGNAYFAPAFMARYLAMVATKPWADAFRAALPVLGKDGTLADVQVGLAGRRKGLRQDRDVRVVRPAQPPRADAREGAGRLLHLEERATRLVRDLREQRGGRIGDPAAISGQALGEIASLAWEGIK